MFLSAKPSDPPLPFPLPPPFILIDSENVENQIGLLKPYYQQRIATLAQQQPPLQPQPPPYQPPGYGFPTPTPYPPLPPPIVVLPDDPPNPAHTKIGPIGQVIKTAPATSSKKKSKAKAKVESGGGDAGGGGGVDAYADGGLETPVMTPHAHLPSESPKKPKGGGAAGGSSGKKKKAVDPPLPAVVLASA